MAQLTEEQQRANPKASGASTWDLGKAIRSHCDVSVNHMAIHQPRKGLRIPAADEGDGVAHPAAGGAAGGGPGPAPGDGTGLVGGVDLLHAWGRELPASYRESKRCRGSSTVHTSHLPQAAALEANAREESQQAWSAQQEALEARCTDLDASAQTLKQEVSMEVCTVAFRKRMSVLHPSGGLLHVTLNITPFLCQHGWGNFLLPSRAAAREAGLSPVDDQTSPAPCAQALQLKAELQAATDRLEEVGRERAISDAKSARQKQVRIGKGRHFTMGVSHIVLLPQCQADSRTQRCVYKVLVSLCLKIPPSQLHPAGA